MRNKIILLVLLGLSLPIAAQKNSKLISWSESRSLNSKDFKARPNKASSYAALTASGISCNISYDGEILSVETTTTFSPKESWIKDKDDQALLAHEQFHFNITELYAREFRKKILNSQFKSRGKRLMKEVTAIYNSTIKELDKYQKQYDNETDHSINKEAQLKWEKKVRERLDSLKDYAKPKLFIKL